MQLDKIELQKALAKRQLSVVEICKIAEISTQSYYRATRTGCRPKTAGKIASALNVPLEDILED